jgi:hypothetical protein
MKKSFAAWTALLACLLLPAAAIADDQASKKWMVGTEIDLVPYVYDGYYLSAVAGYEKWRARFVRTLITTPDFATQSGFEKNKLSVSAFIIDYYFQERFRGWWIGPGYETWSGEVTEKSSSVRKKYRTDILTFGGGYTFRLNDCFYINPWAAVHMPVGGDTAIQFGNNTFRVKATPEASIKFGVNF